MRSPKSVAILCRMGAVGGVTLSAHALAENLEAKSIEVQIADIGKVSTYLNIPSYFRRRHIAVVYWCSGFRSLSLHALLARLQPARTVLFLHGSGAIEPDSSTGESFFGPISTVGLRSFDDIFVTNIELAQAIAEVRSDVRVASAICLNRPTRETGAKHSSSGQLRIVMSEFRGASDPNIYGRDLALSAVKILRTQGYDVSLAILEYGRGQRSNSLLLPSYVDVIHDTKSAEITDLISTYDIFLRPTRSDGDSLIVREALAAGVRVIATDVASRPFGVEVCPPQALSVADAILEGGVPSDGVGVGGPFIHELERIICQI